MTGIIRYAKWQSLDFALDRGRSSLVIIALFWLQAGIATRSLGPEVTLDNRRLYGEAMLAQMIPLLGFVLVLFATNGIVAADRKSGAFRLLLGKPVSAAAYYGQAYALHGFGMLATAAVFLAGFGVIAPAGISWGAIVVFALYYILLGGIGFALSTVSRFDWASTAAVWVVTLMVRSMLPLEARWYGIAADALLPPTHVLADASDAVMRGAMPGAAALLRVVGYGAIAVMLGLLRLRRRPFDE
jgi:hypothetical protein